MATAGIHAVLLRLCRESSVTDRPLPESLAQALPSRGETYRMGGDYALNGASEENYHFLLFAPTPEHVRAWEDGRAAALTRQMTTT